jgi:hypothetical protein
LGNFPRDALAKGILTVEHAPPEWMRGRPIALTCIACNNSAGRRLEPAMPGLDTAIDFVRSTMDKPVDAAFVGPCGRANVSVQARDGTFAVFGLSRSNHPDAHQGYEASLKQIASEPGTRFNITLRHGFRHNEAKVGWLKSAYIVAFAALGYGYVLTKQLQPIREQIAAPDQDLLNGFWANQPKADR